MKNHWGNTIGVTIFGESHGSGIGVIVEGMPPGMEPDMRLIESMLGRRAPGRGAGITTARTELDQVEWLSGLFNGRLTGAPLCAFIKNTDNRSRDYSKIADTPRPGHADYPASVKFGGFYDYRGGGVFSGRLTAPLVFAGALAMQLLQKRGIEIVSHVLRLETLEDMRIDPCDVPLERLVNQRETLFPTIEEGLGSSMEERVRQVSAEGDSLGGIVEAAVVGLPVGLGEPFFGSVESVLSGVLFSIPGIKGVAFGDGFEMAEMRGSQANDAYRYDDGTVKTMTNHNGGITGGMTNAMPLIVRAAVKPTPSIAIRQKTVNLREGQDCELVIGGRHDACIVPRVLPVIEAAAALALLDLLIDNGRQA